MILDLSEVIDRIAKEFPDNSILQLKLGLGDKVLMEPYHSIGEVEFDLNEGIELVRIIGRNLLEAGQFDATDEAELRVKVAQLIQLTDRYVIIKLIGKASKEFVPDLLPGLPADIFTIYYDASKKGCEDQINNILLYLKQYATRYFMEMEAGLKLGLPMF